MATDIYRTTKEVTKCTEDTQEGTTVGATVEEATTDAGATTDEVVT